MKSSAANTALYSGLKQEPGSGRTRSRCVAASIGPKNPLRCRISSVHHPPPGFYSYFRVFTGRNGPSVPPERSSLPVEIQPREPRQRHRSRLRFHRETDSETGAGSVRDVGAGARFGSRAGLLQMSAGSADRDAAVISRPRPSVTAPTNHSPGREPGRAPIGRPACQSLKPLSAT